MLVSPNYIFGFFPPSSGGATGIVDPFGGIGGSNPSTGGVWGSQQSDPVAMAQAAAAAAAAAAANNAAANNDGLYPWEIQSGAGGYFEGGMPNFWDRVASYLPTQAASTTVDAADAARDAARRAKEKGLFSAIAMALGIGSGAVAAGAVIIGGIAVYSVLKK